MRREWLSIGADFDLGWQRVGPRLALIVGSAQLGTARDAAAMVPAVLRGDDPGSDYEVNPRAFAGMTDQGNPLESLLYGAVVHAKAAPVDSLRKRLDAGWGFLSQAAATQISDAGRGAARAAITVRDGVKFVRVVNPPCCKRCAVLAGREYRYSEGFQRHPGCDCTMLPTAVASPAAPGRTVELDQIKDLTKKEREAIEAGADFNLVINTSARSKGRDLREARLDRLIRSARSREQAVNLLKRDGYVA